MRSNNEICDIYKSPDKIRSIRISRIRWAVHVKRTEKNEIPKRVPEYKDEG
jgi:hypothetical protein